MAYLNGFAALAHRGFAPTGLENSMSAFAAARDLGFRYVETDAHATSDGVAVACHDPLLDRTTDIHGAIKDMPWREVRKAKIGGTEPIPAFEDLLGAWPDLRINVDIKAPGAAAAVAAAIERTRAHDRVCVASFSTARRRATVARLSRPVITSASTAEVAKMVAVLAAHRMTGVTRQGAVRALNRALRGVDCLQVPQRAGAVPIVTGQMLAAVHATGRVVHVWTVNDPADMDRLIALGVDGIVTDRADVLRDALKQRGMWE